MVKVRIKYFRLTADGKEFKFNHAGQCEQVLRGLVHSGYTVTIQEVSEIKQVSEEELLVMREDGANFDIIDRPYSGEKACIAPEACTPGNTCR